VQSPQHPGSRYPILRRAGGWGVVFLVLACWGVLLLLNGRAQVRCVRQHRALLVLDNVVERLSVHKSELDVKAITTVLEAELERCDLARERGVKAVCARQGGMWSLYITDGAGGVLAEVLVPGSG